MRRDHLLGDVVLRLIAGAVVSYRREFQRAGPVGQRDTLPECYRANKNSTDRGEDDALPHPSLVSRRG